MNDRLLRARLALIRAVRRMSRAHGLALVKAILDVRRARELEQLEELADRDGPPMPPAPRQPR